MKTEKQIELKVLEMGQEAKEELKERDSISADLVDLDKWYQVISKEGHLFLPPIIQKGVLILRNSEHEHLLPEIKAFVKHDWDNAPNLVNLMTNKSSDALTAHVLSVLHDTRTIHIFFEVVDVEEECINIEFDIATQILDLPEDNRLVKELVEEWRWDYSISIKVPLRSDGMEYGGEVYHYEDATLAVYEKQNRSEEEKKRYINKVLLGDKSYVHKKTVSWFFQIMAYLNHIMEHPELKELEYKPKRKSAGSSPKKERPAESENPVTDKDKTEKVREVNINSLVIRTKAPKTYQMLRSRQIHRVASSWGVRGHFRHYKNGKTVYIKPYTKGADKDKRIKKNYNL